MAAYNDDRPQLETEEEKQDQVQDPGFWAKAGQGKPRPLPKEPDGSHYRDLRGDAT